MPRIVVVRGNELTREQVDIWSSLQEADPTVDSAFFRPEFTQAVASVRRDVEVAILEQHGEPVGFFPFQRSRGNLAQPVVGRLSEFHGVVARRDVAWSAGELIRGAGLTAWHFDHLVGPRKAFEPFLWGESFSPYMDLRGGFETYEAERRRSGSSIIQQIHRKARKLSREVGPLRFQIHCTGREPFEALLTWKSAQHKCTNVLEVLHYRWVVDLLEHIRVTETPGFSGLLSTLHAGDRLVAVHLGMHSRGVLHMWFPAFDRGLEKYSPGLILFLRLAMSAGSLGIERIDLGKGEEPYKARLMSGALRLGEGSVDCRPMSRLIRHQWYKTKRWIRSSPHRAQLEAPLRWTRRFRQRLAFH